MSDMTYNFIKVSLFHCMDQDECPQCTHHLPSQQDKHFLGNQYYL